MNEWMERNVREVSFLCVTAIMRLHLHCCTLALHAHVDVRSTRIQSMHIVQADNTRDHDNNDDDVG